MAGKKEREREAEINTDRGTGGQKDLKTDRHADRETEVREDRNQ
jgi:hypothetical protein